MSAGKSKLIPRCRALLMTGGCSATALIIGWFAGVNHYEKTGFVSDLRRRSTLLAASLIPASHVGSNKPSPPPPPIIGSSRTSQIMRFGFPGTDQLRSLDNYVLSYDRRNRTAHWVFEHLTRQDLSMKFTGEASVDRSKCDFQEDTSVHPFFRSSNNDYKGSGFDRGHLAAAGNHRLSQRHCDQTFLLSNMAPQVGRGFNRDAWNKLEKYVRRLTKFYANVYVCTGPLYLPRKESDGKTYVKYQVIGHNSVAVPTHFFKVVVGETEQHEFEMEAYVMPNTVIDDRTPLHSFQVPVESIERSAGFLLFDGIPRDKFKRINGTKTTFI